MMIDTIYDEVVLLCKKMSYRDKLRLAQLLIQLARKEEEEIANRKPAEIDKLNKHDETQVIKNQKKLDSDLDKIQYIIERLKKSKPKKLSSLQSFITNMFQFRGGISNIDRDKIISELQKNKFIKIDSNNKVIYL
jgi:hypothetical protein